MEAREILGLDVGQKHTGLARASNVARLAEPLMSCPTTDIFHVLTEYLTNHRVEAVAVGLPRSLNGDDSQQTLWVRQWVDEGKQKLEIPFYWQDEALTSELAARKARTLKSKQPKFDDHALSAALILQDFLDSPETERQLA